MKDLSFIHSTADDYPMSIAQFRVYARVLRRAGANGACDESVPNIAKGLGLHPDTVRPALQYLAERMIIEAVHRQGQTTIYKPLHPDRWINPSEKTAGVNKPTPRKISKGTPMKKPQGDPSEKTIDKGAPSEGAPFKGNRISLKKEYAKQLLGIGGGQ